MKSKKEFNKGDIVKVFKGPFKGFYGEFIELAPDKKGRIKFEMFQQFTEVNLHLNIFRKIIPKCGRCGKILDITIKDVANYMQCKKCLKERRQRFKRLRLSLNRKQ